LHEKYVLPPKSSPQTHFLSLISAQGPIIRISPYELHVSTPEFYEELYSGASKKRDKYGWYCKWAATPDGTLGTVEHDLHRLRRGALNPFFSKASARRLQPLIQERADLLLQRVKEYGSAKKVLTISVAYVAFAAGKWNFTSLTLS
jgi:hypothetical protein